MLPHLRVLLLSRSISAHGSVTAWTTVGCAWGDPCKVWMGITIRSTDVHHGLTLPSHVVPCGWLSLWKLRSVCKTNFLCQSQIYVSALHHFPLVCQQSSLCWPLSAPFSIWSTWDCQFYQHNICKSDSNAKHVIRHTDPQWSPFSCML